MLQYCINFTFLIDAFKSFKWYVNISCFILNCLIILFKKKTIGFLNIFKKLVKKKKINLSNTYNSIYFNIQMTVGDKHKQ